MLQNILRMQSIGQSAATPCSHKKTLSFTSVPHENYRKSQFTIKPWKKLAIRGRQSHILARLNCKNQLPQASTQTMDFVGIFPTHHKPPKGREGAYSNRTAHCEIRFWCPILPTCTTGVRMKPPTGTNDHDAKCITAVLVRAGMVQKHSDFLQAVLVCIMSVLFILSSCRGNLALWNRYPETFYGLDFPENNGVFCRSPRPSQTCSHDSQREGDITKPLLRSSPALSLLLPGIRSRYAADIFQAAPHVRPANKTQSLPLARPRGWRRDWGAPGIWYRLWD